MLTGAEERLTGSYADWQNDPYRQQAMDQLSSMSEPGYSIISDAQQEGYNRQIGQNYATNAAALEADAASRGVAGGGASTAQEAGLRGVADAGALQVRASIDEANESARRSSVETLGRLGLAQREVDLAFESSLDSLARMGAAIEAGEEFSPSEFLGYTELSDAMRRADSEEAFRLEQLDAMNEAAQKDVWDWFSILAQSVGTGLWG